MHETIETLNQSRYNQIPNAEQLMCNHIPKLTANCTRVKSQSQHSADNSSVRTMLAQQCPISAIAPPPPPPQLCTAIPTEMLGWSGAAHTLPYKSAKLASVRLRLME